MGVFLLFNVKLVVSIFTSRGQEEKLNSRDEDTLADCRCVFFFQSQFQLQEQKYCNKRKKQNKN